MSSCFQLERRTGAPIDPKVAPAAGDSGLMTDLKHSTAACHPALPSTDSRRLPACSQRVFDNTTVPPNKRPFLSSSPETCTCSLPWQTRTDDTQPPCQRMWELWRSGVDDHWRSVRGNCRGLHDHPDRPKRQSKGRLTLYRRHPLAVLLST
jgi:hypothetical protein